MTKKEFKEKTIHLIDENSGIREIVLNACISAMSNKMAEGRFLAAAENNFMLPKAVLTAVLQELAWQHAPLSSEGKKMVKELKPLIKF